MDCLQNYSIGSTHSSTKPKFMSHNFDRTDGSPDAAKNLVSSPQMRYAQGRNEKELFMSPVSQSYGKHLPLVGPQLPGVSPFRDWSTQVDAQRLRQWRDISTEEKTRECAVYEGLKAEIHWRRCGVWKSITFGRYEPRLRMWQVFYGKDCLLKEWIDPLIETLRLQRGSKQEHTSIYRRDHGILSSGQNSEMVTMRGLNSNVEGLMKQAASTMHPVLPLQAGIKKSGMPSQQQSPFLFPLNKNISDSYSLQRNELLVPPDLASITNLAYGSGAEVANFTGCNFTLNRATTLPVKMTKNESSGKPKKRKKRSRPHKSNTKKKTRKKKKGSVKVEKSKSTKDSLCADSNLSDSPREGSGRVTTPAPTSLLAEYTQSESPTPQDCFNVMKLPSESKLTVPTAQNESKNGNLQRMFNASGSKFFDDPFDSCSLEDCLINRFGEHDSVYGGAKILTM